jgi:hypothetical protein
MIYDYAQSQLAISVYSIPLPLTQDLHMICIIFNVGGGPERDLAYTPRHTGTNPTSQALTGCVAFHFTETIGSWSCLQPQHSNHNTLNQQDSKLECLLHNASAGTCWKTASIRCGCASPGMKASAAATQIQPDNALCIRIRFSASLLQTRKHNPNADMED